MATFHRIPPVYQSLDLTGLANHIWFENDNLNSPDEQKREWAKDRLIVLNRLQAERLAALAEMEQEVALEVA